MNRQTYQRLVWKNCTLNICLQRLIRLINNIIEWNIVFVGILLPFHNASLLWFDSPDMEPFSLEHPSSNQKPQVAQVKCSAALLNGHVSPLWFCNAGHTAFPENTGG